ncbi:hypothetical protein AB0D99_04950 [Streptomyces sp. NPDC047971]|uniref:hypothetical protein n=1 Tax=Streptomyces sp. NPDC047971 TaxID=3154499 RepID=UPI0033D9B282
MSVSETTDPNPYRRSETQDAERAVRAHHAATSGAAMAATAALTSAYAIGWRAGRRTRGPMARLLGRRT